MDNTPKAPSAPVEMARIALRAMTEGGIPPTPSNYAREYRRAAGLSPEEALPEDVSAGPELVELVQGIIRMVNQTSSGLATGMDEFEVDSKRLLEGADQVTDKRGLTRMLKALTTSALSLQQRVQTSRSEINETRQKLEQVSVELQRSQAVARSDPLTGMCNRRGMDEIIAREVARSRRTGEQFSVAIIDIDHFKKVNDTYGHDAGDKALVHLASVAKSSLRESDVICRYGGEEFVLVLPGAGAHGAQFVIDRLRTLVENTPLLLDNAKLTLRFSGGVADLQPGENAEALLQRADKALYGAKHAGRNCVMIAPVSHASRAAAGSPATAHA